MKRLRVGKRGLLVLVVVLGLGAALYGIVKGVSRTATYNVYFGDLHAHTGYSDGSGTPAEAFSHARSSGRGDFLAITDHQDKSYPNTTYQLSPDEWADIQAQADAHTDGSFVALAGFEMTRSVWGHMNTFNTGLIDDVTNAAEEYYDLLAARPESISQWNHPTDYSNDFENYLNATDYYAYHSPARDGVVCLIEVVNGATLYETSYVKALDAGWHVAPTANSDTHAADWLTGCECRTAVLAPGLTREDVYDALRNRRVYATQNSNLDVAYTINGSVMGSILSALGPLNVAVRVHDPDVDNANDRITVIDIVSNGGVVVESRRYGAHSAALSTRLTASAPSYYFVRVTNAGGEKAYTAPIWAGETGPPPVASQ